MIRAWFPIQLSIMCVCELPLSHITFLFLRKLQFTFSRNQRTVFFNEKKPTKALREQYLEPGIKDTSNLKAFYKLFPLLVFINGKIMFKSNICNFCYILVFCCVDLQKICNKLQICKLFICQQSFVFLMRNLPND